MLIQCGPLHDRRIMNFYLPSEPKFVNDKIRNLWLKINKLKQGNRIGCLVSGGMDSALLYYCLLKENIETGNKFIITPYTIMRKNGSKIYALPLINYIRSLFNLEPISLNIIGDVGLNEIQQVESGIKDVLHVKEDYVYLGIITERPEHSVGWFRATFKETTHRKYPFLNLEKSHIVDLILQLGLEQIFRLSHTCAIEEITPCGNCNGCNERAWGFRELGLEPL